VHSVMGGGRGGEAPQQPAPPQQAAGPAQAAAQDPCGQTAKYFADCMSANNGDFAVCEPYFQAMQQCKYTQGSATFAG